MRTLVQGWLTAVALAGVLLAAGCGKGGDPQTGDPGSPTLQVNSPSAGVPTHLDPRLHRPFKQATFQEPPGEQQRPPDVTAAGKVVWKMYEEIAGQEGAGGLWDKIVFASADGKRLQYSATLKTDVGSITIELWPDVAPGHVRNFLALAKVGYYNGLAFDRIYKEDLTEDGAATAKTYSYLQAGCPLGTGDGAYGSIGYWLRPELNDKTHEEGTVGAWHGGEVETAACNFYITLNKMPWMDRQYTVFGKVTHGLDVARIISSRPLSEEEPGRPKEPVKIREVTVQCTELPAAAGTK
jgi:peptidyl-prolyl cis-trans isomerase B (cyclophilin B)